MAIRKQLGPWQEKLIKILIRRWGVRHGGIWPDAQKARRVRNQVRVVVSRDMYSGRAVPWLCNTPSHASEEQRESRAKAACLKLLRQEAAGKWQADAYLCYARETGQWKELGLHIKEIRHAKERALCAHAVQERQRYYVFPDRGAHK